VLQQTWLIFWISQLSHAKQPLAFGRTDVSTFRWKGVRENLLYHLQRSRLTFSKVSIPKWPTTIGSLSSLSIRRWRQLVSKTLQVVLDRDVQSTIQVKLEYTNFHLVLSCFFFTSMLNIHVIRYVLSFEFLHLFNNRSWSNRTPSTMNWYITRQVVQPEIVTKR